MRQRVTSRANPLLVRLRKVREKRSFRRAEGVFFCEGPKLLEEAVRWDAALETVICQEGFALPGLPDSVRVAEVPPGLLRSLADTDTPQGVVFTCRLPNPAPLDALRGERFLVLDGVQDPGNVGTIWRSCDAFGADALLLGSGCADPFSPKTIRATMGAVFRLPVYQGEARELARVLGRLDVPLYAAALSNRAMDLRAADLRRAAVIIGSEGRGVSRDALALCRGTIKIPMRARCESLNAAAAASVILWEMGKRCDLWQT